MLARQLLESQRFRSCFQEAIEGRYTRPVAATYLKLIFGTYHWVPHAERK
jgi:hypothetical protein